MARLKTKVYLYIRKLEWETEWTLSVRDWEDGESDECILLETREIFFDLPRDWDPREKQIVALRTQLQTLRATAAVKEIEIEGKIANLLAIEGPAS